MNSLDVSHFVCDFKSSQTLHIGKAIEYDVFFLAWTDNLKLLQKSFS